MKAVAEELNTMFGMETIEIEEVVFEAVVLDEVDKYRKKV